MMMIDSAEGNVFLFGFVVLLFKLLAYVLLFLQYNTPIYWILWNLSYIISYVLLYGILFQTLTVTTTDCIDLMSI